MLTGDIRGQVDAVWNAFWSGGISNPLEVIEQITYLLFVRRLHDQLTLEENKANRLGKPIENAVFPAGKDARSRSFADLRWSRFKHFDPADLFTVVGYRMSPFRRSLVDVSTFVHLTMEAQLLPTQERVISATPAVAMPAFDR